MAKKKKNVASESNECSVEGLYAALALFAFVGLIFYGVHLSCKPRYEAFDCLLTENFETVRVSDTKLGEYELRPLRLYESRWGNRLGTDFRKDDYYKSVYSVDQTYQKINCEAKP